MTQTIEQRQSPREAQAWCQAARSAGKRIGFVPTMGALHEGHISLVRRAREECDVVVVSVFVNPLQFGQQADLDAYPRDFEADALLLAQAGCDLVFTGSLIGEMGFFPEAQALEEIVSEVVGKSAQGLESEFRTGHFEGVATIVKRLFQIAVPHRAYFGAKDYQQTLVIRELTARMLHGDSQDCVPELTICPIARDTKGLALSSRNLRLTDTGKATALALVGALTLGRHLWRVEGLRDALILQSAMESELLALGGPGLTLEYMAIRDPNSWSATSPEGDLDQAIALVAAHVDGVRLIDNMRLDVVASNEAPPLSPRAGELAAVLVEAPAKINPWLEVLGRQDTGFHEVELTMVCIDLVDHLRISWVRGDVAGSIELTLSGPAASADIPVDRGNLVYRAAELAIDAYPGTLPTGHLRIELHKRIPSRAGLGGGSSDAAAALLGVVQLLQQVGDSKGGMTKAADQAAALATLGSDCPFFLEAASTGFGKCTGRGEIVEAIHPGEFMGRSFELVVPGIECGTSQVFGALQLPKTPRGFDPGILFNRLEEAAFSSCPKLAQVAEALTTETGDTWHISGSGSSLFRELDQALWMELGASGNSVGAPARRVVKSRHEGKHRPTGYGVRILDIVRPG
ncbi:MAG: pantoate--beta-alanine ligase [Planctomycetota bacterium]|nr:pantoate--beta-alanine ligase [Planctomycetota bacterium]